MKKFNAKTYYNNTIFTCLKCKKSFAFQRTSDGCLNCGFNLFKIAYRGTLNPTMWDWDVEDPYLRQKRAPITPGSGKGEKRNTPGDEEFGGGLGSRFRNKNAPRDFSMTSDEYKEQLDNDIPASYHTLMENDPIIGEGASDGRFFDPIDPLSDSYNVAKYMDGHNEDDADLGPHNMHRRRPRKKKNVDNSIFDWVANKQKGTRP